MKAALIAAFAMLAASFAHAEDDPFADPAPDLPRPERKISSLPKSIAHEARDGMHVYTISEIYATSPEHEIDDPGSLSEAFIPDCEDCTFDFKKRTCTITTSRELTFSELAYAIDDIAGMGGDMPYWAELAARDLPETEEFSELDFVAEEFGGDFPERLAWFSLPDDQPFEIPFPITQIDHFKVLIVPTTAFCMCHSRYCVRILDPAGKLVWKDSSTAFAGMSVAIAVSDNGVGPELLMRRDDHGEEASFVVKIKSEQGGAEQPATRSESDSEGGDKPKPESEGHPR
ncbi:MAG: hypothetical protein H7A48_01230 [Akkermansiaceae bacterium]|nr:hypothetical protein [Akkermansiaceae bacterium]